jgi:hypothetical protein
VSVTVCAVVWLFFEMRAYKRLRIFAFDPETDANHAPDASSSAPADSPSEPPREPRDES